MTPDEKNTCREIAREIVKEVLLEHVKSCPHGIKIQKFWMFILGAGIASGYSISEIIRQIFT